MYAEAVRELEGVLARVVRKASLIRDLVEDVKGEGACGLRRCSRLSWVESVEALVATEKRQGELESGQAEKGAADKALWVLSEVIVNALGHFVGSLDYLVILPNQGVFNFVALPAVMAIATLELPKGF